MDFLKTITNPFNLVKDIAAETTIKQFNQKFDFVYLGTAGDPHNEHYQMIRGITSSASHNDQHYSVGDFRGHDVVIVLREDTLTRHGKSPQDYRWLIMQIDLRRNALPHLFIDGHHHNDTFYTNFFIKFAHFHKASEFFVDHDPLFNESFTVLARPVDFDNVRLTLTSTITSMLAHHFTQFDYEIDGDKLLLYSSGRNVSVAELQEMLRVGSWLADMLNDTPTL